MIKAIHALDYRFKSEQLHAYFVFQPFEYFILVYLDQRAYSRIVLCIILYFKKKKRR